MIDFTEPLCGFTTPNANFYNQVRKVVHSACVLFTVISIFPIFLVLVQKQLEKNIYTFYNPKFLWVKQRCIIITYNLLALSVHTNHRNEDILENYRELSTPQNVKLFLYNWSVNKSDKMAFCTTARVAKLWYFFKKLFFLGIFF